MNYEEYLTELKARDIISGAIGAGLAANAGHIIANAPGPGGGVKANPAKQQQVKKDKDHKKAPVEQNYKTPGWLKAELKRF